MAVSASASAQAARTHSAGEGPCRLTPGSRSRTDERTLSIAATTGAIARGGQTRAPAKHTAEAAYMRAMRRCHVEARPAAA